MHTVKVEVIQITSLGMALPVPAKLRLTRPMVTSLDVRIVVFGTVTPMNGLKWHNVNSINTVYKRE
jgi:hypothetical protein